MSARPAARMRVDGCDATYARRFNDRGIGRPGPLFALTPRSPLSVASPRTTSIDDVMAAWQQFFVDLSGATTRRVS